MNEKRKRSPKGIDHRAIALRLMPDERKNAEMVSNRIGCSMSSLAAAAYRKGLPLVMNEQEPA